MLPSQLRLGVTVTAGSVCEGMVHQAQEGETPWVEASLRLLDLNSVEVCMQLCAELLRFSGVKDVRDRVGQGTITVYSLGGGTSAHSADIPDVLLVAQESGICTGPYVHR